MGVDGVESNAKQVASFYTKVLLVYLLKGLEGIRYERFEDLWKDQDFYEVYKSVNSNGIIEKVQRECIREINTYGNSDEGARKVLGSIIIRLIDAMDEYCKVSDCVREEAILICCSKTASNACDLITMIYNKTKGFTYFDTSADSIKAQYNKYLKSKYQELFC